MLIEYAVANSSERVVCNNNHNKHADQRSGKCGHVSGQIQHARPLCQPQTEGNCAYHYRDMYYLDY
jgi:hypothetical protein